MEFNDNEEIGKEPAWLSLLHGISVISALAIIVLILNGITYRDVYNVPMSFELSPRAQLVNSNGEIRLSPSFRNGDTIHLGDFVGTNGLDSIVSEKNGIILFSEVWKENSELRTTSMIIIPLNSILIGTTSELLNDRFTFPQKCYYVHINNDDRPSTFLGKAINVNKDSPNLNELKLTMKIPILDVLGKIEISGNNFNSDVEIKGPPLSLRMRLLNFLN